MLLIPFTSVFFLLPRSKVVSFRKGSASGGDLPIPNNAIQIANTNGLAHLSLPILDRVGEALELEGRFLRLSINACS